MARNKLFAIILSLFVVAAFCVAPVQAYESVTPVDAMQIRAIQADIHSEFAIQSPVGGSGEFGYFVERYYGADGTLKDVALAFNALDDEGEQSMLSCYLQATSCPTTFFLRLSDSSSTCSIAETDSLTLASAGEPSTNGYAAEEITRDGTGWPTLALDAGDYQADALEVTFSASGGAWGPVYCAFLGTTSNNTGKLISHAALSTGRTLAAGESLAVSYSLKQQ